ncbi:MAG TPA: hypothetical protein VK108_10880 [Pseudogracilibacillus sp.]|nr:hypothetical protein [Pseudogracilibacillus sp.]
MTQERSECVLFGEGCKYFINPPYFKALQFDGKIYRYPSSLDVNPPPTAALSFFLQNAAGKTSITASFNEYPSSLDVNPPSTAALSFFKQNTAGKTSLAAKFNKYTPSLAGNPSPTAALSYFNQNAADKSPLTASFNEYTPSLAGNPPPTAALSFFHQNAAGKTPLTASFNESPLSSGAQKLRLLTGSLPPPDSNPSDAPRLPRETKTPIVSSDEGLNDFLY